jgi:hypothetical protein
MYPGQVLQMSGIISTKNQCLEFIGCNSAMAKSAGAHTAKSLFGRKDE